MEEATRVLTGLSSWSAPPLTNGAAAALVLTGGGGGLGGSRWVCAEAGAGDVRSTNSDRSVSSWGTKGANQSDQSTAEHAQWSSTGEDAATGERGAAASWRQT